MRAAGARPVHLHKVASLRSGRKCPVTGGSHGVVWLCLDACSWLSGAVAGRTRGAVSRRVRAPRLSDPIVLSHAQALLTSSPEGMTDYIQADLRDTDTILKGAARILDFTRPVAILLIAVLHFIPDADDPYAIVARLMDAAPSGSYLVMAHAASDIAPEASAEMARRYNQMASATVTPRTRDQLARFFTGLDLLPPGLVPISKWALSGPIDSTTGVLVGYCAIARKP